MSAGRRGGPSKKTESPRLLDENGNLIGNDFLNLLIQYSLDHNIDWKVFADRAILVSTGERAFSRTTVIGDNKSLLRIAQLRLNNLRARKNKLDIGDYCPFKSHHLLFDPAIAPADVEGKARHLDPPSASKPKPSTSTMRVPKGALVHFLCTNAGLELGDTSDVLTLTRDEVERLSIEEYYPSTEDDDNVADYRLRELPVSLQKGDMRQVTTEDGNTCEVLSTTLRMQVVPNDQCRKAQMFLVDVEDEDKRDGYRRGILVAKQNNTSHIEHDIQNTCRDLDEEYGRAERSSSARVIEHLEGNNETTFEIYYLDHRNYVPKYFHNFQGQAARCHLKPIFRMFDRGSNPTDDVERAYRAYLMTVVHNCSMPPRLISRRQTYQDVDFAAPDDSQRPDTYHDGCLGPRDIPAGKTTEDLGMSRGNINARGHPGYHRSQGFLPTRNNSVGPQRQGQYVSPQRQNCRHSNSQRQNYNHSPQRQNYERVSPYHNYNDIDSALPQSQSPRDYTDEDDDAFQGLPPRLSTGCQTDRTPRQTSRSDSGQRPHGPPRQTFQRSPPRQTSQRSPPRQTFQRSPPRQTSQHSSPHHDRNRSHYPPPPPRSVRGGNIHDDVTHSGGNIGPVNRILPRQNDHSEQDDINLAATTLAGISISNPRESSSRRLELLLDAHGLSGDRQTNRPGSSRRQGIPQEIYADGDDNSRTSWPGYATEADEYDDCRSSALDSRDGQNGPTAVRGSQGRTGGQGPIVSESSSSRGG